MRRVVVVADELQRGPLRRGVGPAARAAFHGTTVRAPIAASLARSALHVSHRGVSSSNTTVGSPQSTQDAGVGLSGQGQPMQM